MSNEVNKDADANKIASEKDMNETATASKPAVENDESPNESAASKPVAENQEPAAETQVDQAPTETPNSDTVDAAPDKGSSGAEAPEPSVEPPADKKDSVEEQTGEEPSGEMDFGAMLEQFEQEQVSYHAGELVKGKVVGLSDNGALVDFGYKSEGTVSLEEFTSDEGEVTIKQGDEVEVVIKSMGTGDSPPSLSRFDAERRKTWNDIEDAFNEESVVKGTVTDKTKGGLKVDLQGVEAFLPGSQVDSRPVRNLDNLIGKEIEAKVIKFSRKRNNIVLSRKVITDEVVNKLKSKTLARIEEGFIEEGTVKNLTDYGAFVDIGGIDGLLHVTDMSWGRLHNPGDMFKVGEVVQVKILKLDREKEKVSLGFKQLLPDPWSTVTELYPVESRIKGRVSSVTEYGAFVELEPGVEGLVHVSEMSWSKRLKHPKHLVKKGDEVEVQVLGIDPDERRISLGIKQLQENPWDTIAERFQVGTKIEGKVRNLTDFGAFVEVEEGVDGLVHVSDISWSKKIKHPKDVLKKGQEVEAVVTNIDVAGRRLSLSIKELTPSAWEQFTNEHKPGDVVKGTISRFASFGIFVELAPDLEGLCHISELSDERVEDPEDDFEIGQELEFKILRIEHDVEKIGLSHRAVGKEDEPVTDSRSYSSEAKGGMASLGELANLNIGGSAGEEASEKAPAESDKKGADADADADAESKSAEADKAPETAKDAVEDKAEPGKEAEDSKDKSADDDSADKSADGDSKDKSEDDDSKDKQGADDEKPVGGEDSSPAAESSADPVEAESKTEDAANASPEPDESESEKMKSEPEETEEAKAKESAGGKGGKKAAEKKSSGESATQEQAADEAKVDAESASNAAAETPESEGESDTKKTKKKPKEKSADSK